MPRYYDKSAAFDRAVKRDASGRKLVTTRDFISELKKVNWDMSLKEANEWIEIYTCCFKDVSTEEGQARTFEMFNHNGGR